MGSWSFRWCRMPKALKFYIQWNRLLYAHSEDCWIYLLNKRPLPHLCEAKCDTDKLLWSGTCSGVVISPALPQSVLKARHWKCDSAAAGLLSRFGMTLCWTTPTKTVRIHDCKKSPILESSISITPLDTHFLLWGSSANGIARITDISTLAF